MAWPDTAPRRLRPNLARVARRLELGAPLRSSIETLHDVLEDDATALGVVLDAASALGGRAASMVETLAASVETRVSFASQARAAGSGAVLSGRLVAGLPLGLIPVMPLAQGPLFDPLGLTTLVAGGGLAVLGLAWITRLTPDVPTSDDPAAALADLIAAALAGGTHQEAALAFLAERPPAALEDALRKARRLVRLGARWSEALEASNDDGLRSLAAALARAEELGVPVGASLTSWSRARRIELGHRFEGAARRAGVLMMIPLATCVLPSFIFLGIVPFLRGLSLQ